MAKKDVIVRMLTRIMSAMPEERIIVADNPKLREKGRGMHAYCLGYDVDKKSLQVYPWWGASYSWELDASTKLTIRELEELAQKALDKFI